MKDSTTVIDKEKPKAYGWGLRHIQALMLALAMTIAYANRVSTSIAVVSMTDATNDHYFEWSNQIQSYILSSFFWGYIVLQIPSGVLAAKFGGKILITLCIGINSAVSLLVPLASKYGGWQLVCACRVIQGLSQGFLFPSTHTLIGKWIPVEEKSSLGTFIYAGTQIGTALQFTVAGYIAEYWGWPGIFYGTGIIGGIWTVVYIFIGADSPQNSKLINAKERFFIQSSLGQIGEPKKLKTPWKTIWKSVPFISLIIVHCGHNWGLWTLLTEIPTYYAKVLDVDIKANGLLSALPYLATFIASFPVGYLSAKAQSKNWMSLTVSRKLSNSMAHFIPALALIGLSFAPTDNPAASVALLTLAMMFNAGHFAGFLLVHIDMAPNFAGQMMGITNFFANIISIIAPLVAGLLLEDETDMADWRKVFYLSSAIYITCNTIFLIFGTSEKQQWNEVSDNNNEADSEIQNNVEKLA